MPIYVPRQERQDTLAKLVRAPDPWPVIRAFPSDISPVYDDRPFFFYAVRPGELFSAVLDFDKLMINSFSVAVLVALFAIVALLVLAFILVPLLAYRREALRSRPLSKLRDLGFFVAIGVGFIVVEVALLQRFGLFLGHPSYSLVVVLFSILLASGLGSFLSERIPEKSRRTGLAAAAGGILAVLIAYTFLLPWVFDRWLGAGLSTRVVIAALLTAVPGVAMGMMLPSGVRLISTRHPEIVPWGWGVNGAASVFGSVAAMMVAMNLGSRVSFLVGAGCYALALLAGFRRPGAPSPREPSPGPADEATPAPDEERMTKDEERLSLTADAPEAKVVESEAKEGTAS